MDMIEVAYKEHSESIGITESKESVGYKEQIEVTHTVEESTDIGYEERVEFVEIVEEEATRIDVDEMFPAFGEANTLLKHSILNDRELADQHPITAITGLRDELNDIKALKSVYSNKANHADYYLWDDENPNKEIRTGYFVTISADTNHINICNSDGSDVFGVTIGEAAFIGNQNDVERDYKYGLVANSGLVAVRCESDIEVGDYVVSNNFGFGKKSTGEYGYYVFVIDNISGIRCAVIGLGVSANQMSYLGREVEDVSARVHNAETNIATAINVANSAYNFCLDLDNFKVEITEKTDEAIEKADQALSTTDKYGSQIQEAVKTSEQAKIIANSAIASAESIRVEAVSVANNALSNVNKLVDDMKPISTWVDIETGNVGAEYLVNYIQDGVATKSEVQVAESNTQIALAEALANAKYLQTLVSTIDKYNVGKYSTAYELTREQASNILEKDIIYVPTVDHSETYSDLTQEFSKTYYYTWDGTKWIESNAPYVLFSSVYVTGNDKSLYWYTGDEDVTDETTGDVYGDGTLYKWENGKWMAVATLEGNVTSREVSLVRQQSNEISMTVSGLQGNMANLTERVDEHGASITTLTTWQGETDTKMATIESTANDASASIAMVVQNTDGDKKINAASIVAAINDSDSSVVIEADRIDLNGYVTISNLENGTTTINGACITTGAIQSSNYVADTSGMKLTLSDGTWDSPHFKIDSTGQITATSGQIANWDIKGDGLWTETDKFSIWLTGASEYGQNVFAVQDKTKNTYPFVVKSDGSLYATNADIEGKIKATSGEIGGCTIADGKLQVAAANITSGTINSARIPNLSAGKITTGTLNAANVTISNLSVSKLTAGTNSNKITLTDADVKGKITATSGKIGGWELFTNYEDQWLYGVSTVSGTKYEALISPIGVHIRKNGGTNGLYRLIRWVDLADSLGVPETDLLSV